MEVETPAPADSTVPAATCTCTHTGDANATAVPHLRPVPAAVSGGDAPSGSPVVPQQHDAMRRIVEAAQNNRVDIDAMRE